MTNATGSNGQTILTLKNDFIFKVVYGSDNENSKFILKSLLNKILKRENDPITDIEYKNPFQLRRYPDDKETVLDIKVTTDCGDLIDIEIQLIWQKDLKERFIMYHGGLIRESLHKGEPYDRMKKTITIGIVDAVFLEDEEDFLNEFYFINRKSHALLSGQSYICCIELPKVNREKKPIEELTPLEVCLEYLKHADENGSAYVDALIHQGGKELQMAQEMLRKATEDEILREQAIAREKFENDMISINYHRREAEENLKQAKAELMAKQENLARTKVELMAKQENLARLEKDLARLEENYAREQEQLIQAKENLAQTEKSLVQTEENLAQAEKNLALAEEERDQAKQEAEQKARTAYDSGVEEGVKKTAAKLKARGMSDDEIGVITGLSVLEIAQL